MEFGRDGAWLDFVAIAGRFGSLRLALVKRLETKNSGKTSPYREILTKLREDSLLFPQKFEISPDVSGKLFD